MKSMYIYVLCWVAVFVALSCNKGVSTKRTEYVLRGSSVEIVILDECEYVVWSSTITHKGNCKNPIHQCK